MEIGRIQDQVTRLTPNGNRMVTLTTLFLPEIGCYTVSAVYFQLYFSFTSASLKLSQVDGARVDLKDGSWETGGFLGASRRIGPRSIRYELLFMIHHFIGPTYVRLPDFG